MIKKPTGRALALTVYQILLILRFLPTAITQIIPPKIQIIDEKKETPVSSVLDRWFEALDKSVPVYSEPESKTDPPDQQFIFSADGWLVSK